MKSFEEKLASVSAEWVSAGLIGADTRTALLARHPVIQTGASRILAIFAGVGGALLLAGVSLVIKANWDRLGDWLKIAGVVALLLGAYAAGWRWKVSPGRSPKTGDACLMVGAVLFLLGIALVSQIFHLESRPSHGVLLWWLGIAAVPWLTRAKGAQFVSVIAGLTWLAMELQAADSWVRLSATGERWYAEEFFHFASAGGLVGVALLTAGLALRRTSFSLFAGLHEKLGLGLVCWALYALGFTWSGDMWRHHAMVPARWEAVAFLVVLAAGGVVAALRRNRTEVTSLAIWLVPGLVSVAAHLGGIELGDAGWLWGGLSCVALFVFNFGLVRRGLETGREGWINLGIVGLALNVFTRYFLLFGTMLEGGVFFIVTGLLVIGLGYFLERKRRTLVGAVRKEVAS